LRQKDFNEQLIEEENNRLQELNRKFIKLAYIPIFIALLLFTIAFNVCINMPLFYIYNTAFITRKVYKRKTSFKTLFKWVFLGVFVMIYQTYKDLRENIKDYLFLSKTA
jgi:hypothetical protein